MLEPANEVEARITLALPRVRGKTVNLTRGSPVTGLQASPAHMGAREDRQPAFHPVTASIATSIHL